MPAALSPQQAIAYVRELSADVRAVAVLDAGGAATAGPPALAAAARELLAASDATELVVRTPAGVVFVARSPACAIVAVAGPLSLVGPTALDLRAALAALQGRTIAGAEPSPPAPVDTPSGALATAADAALRAA